MMSINLQEVLELIQCIGKRELLIATGLNQSRTDEDKLSKEKRGF